MIGVTKYVTNRRKISGSGITNNYQAVILKKKNEIVQKGDSWYYKNYGVGGDAADLKINNTQVVTTNDDVIVNTAINANIFNNGLSFVFMGKITNNDNTAGLVEIYNDNDNRISLYYHNSGYWGFRYGFGSNNLAITSHNFSLNTFYIIVGTIDENNHLSLYVNGVLESDVVEPNLSIGTNNVMLFAYTDIYKMVGNAYRMLIYDRALTVEEIANNDFNSNGCLADYNFQEGDGNTIYDASGNGNHGNITFTSASIMPYPDASYIQALADFWGTKVDDAYPALLVKGYERYINDNDINKVINVIKATNGFITPVITDYHKEYELNVNCGFSNTGNTLKQPDNDTELIKVDTAYSLGWYDGSGLAQVIDWNMISNYESKHIGFSINNDITCVNKMLSDATYVEGSPLEDHPDWELVSSEQSGATRTAWFDFTNIKFNVNAVNAKSQNLAYGNYISNRGAIAFDLLNEPGAGNMWVLFAAKMFNVNNIVGSRINGANIELVKRKNGLWTTIKSIPKISGTHWVTIIDDTSITVYIDNVRVINAAHNISGLGYFGISMHRVDTAVDIFKNYVAGDVNLVTHNGEQVTHNNDDVWYRNNI